MEEKLLLAIDDYNNEMINMLQTLVNIDSNADCPEGINKVAHVIGEFLLELGFEVSYPEVPGVVTHIIAKRAGNAKNPKKIMMIGHMDTVFPKGTAEERPFSMDAEKAYGPGVLDMKSGITIALYAVKSLIETDLFENDITIFFSGDEECAHQHSDAAKMYLDLAKDKDAVFNMETGADSGSVVLSRTGAYLPKIYVDGIAAHSGKDPQKGASAIRELVFKLADLYRFADTDDNISFNAGIIRGGVAANGIAAHAEMEGDFRFKTVEAGPKIQAALQEICEKTYVPRTTTKLDYNPQKAYIPMERTQKNEWLYEIVHAQGKKLGIEIATIGVGSGSDSCFTSCAGAPTVCAMGARGELNHSSKEYIWLYSLTERAKLLALSILAVGHTKPYEN